MDENGNATINVAEREKDFIVKIIPNLGSLYQVSLKGGGQVPEMLSGKYTSIVEAEKAIKRYLNEFARTK